VRAARRRFSRFSAVGVIGAGLQLLLMSLLTKCFGLLSVIATPVAVEITLLHNFIWHERFTWSESRAKRSTQLVDRLWRFHAANGLISLGGNTILHVLSGGAAEGPRDAGRDRRDPPVLGRKFPRRGSLGVRPEGPAMRARRADIMGRDPNLTWRSVWETINICLQAVENHIDSGKGLVL